MIFRVLIEFSQNPDIKQYLKEHKPYEFENKSSFAYTRKAVIIVGAMAVDGNAYDGHSLKPQLDQIKGLTEGKSKKRSLIFN